MFKTAKKQASIQERDEEGGDETDSKEGEKKPLITRK